MPNEPLREQILEAVSDVLSGIVAGTTYWSTPALVTRALLSIGHYKVELESGPVYGVTRSSGSELAFQAQPFLYGTLFRFTVEAFVRLRDGVMAGTWLERAWQDHVTALLADPYLGGLVMDLRPETTETDDGALEPEAWFRQVWTAEASTDLTPDVSP